MKPCAGLARVASKADLQRARHERVRDPNLAPPFYRAPCLLISNWL
jgi:hypothetical protein